VILTEGSVFSMASKSPGNGVLILIAVLLSACLETAAGDDTRGTEPPPVFSVHDTDGDGFLSRREYAMFYRDFEERHKQAGRPAHRMLSLLAFEQIDHDGDGRISVHEMVAALQARRQGPGWRWRQPPP
jgi:Ca2+-binding EF-hand superfamily protein